MSAGQITDTITGSNADDRSGAVALPTGGPAAPYSEPHSLPVSADSLRGGLSIPAAPAFPKLKVLDLFSGIGGFSLGLERTGGFETVAFCEIEEFPRKVLAKHWPGVPCYHDVRELTGERLASDGITRVDTITGGFPCQDLSFAGKMGGISAERSGLWGEIVRLVGELRPSFVIVENVTALLAGERGAWFGRVLGDLASLGYDAEWHSIPSSAVGGPSGRDRTWIVAYPGQEHNQVPGANTSLEGREEQARRTPLEDGDFYRLVRGVPVGVADYWWRAQSSVARTSDEIPDRLDRLAALGNTIDPFIPELIGNAILQSLHHTGSNEAECLAAPCSVSSPFHEGNNAR